LHVRHDEEGQSVDVARVEERKYQRMGESCRNANLSEEPLGAQRRGDLRAKHLEGDWPLVLSVVGEVNDSRAPEA